MDHFIGATGYRLQSQVSSELFDDTGWLLDAPGESKPGLVRAIYDEKQLNLRGVEFGLYRYSGWLPIRRTLSGSSAPVTFKSEGFGKVAGIRDLFITFSGYWPEKGAFMRTCSFKETEAYSVCARLNPDWQKVLVVASAGNTARAFARVCSDNAIPLLLSVPEDNLEALWFDTPISDCVQLISSRSGSDYFDAIHLSNIVGKGDRFLPEGGAKNVARRDGMGTTVLSAVTTIGWIPDYYFQAIGSGTGAIAAWEANLRLIGDGRYGQNKMKLMLSQNAPFTPIIDAWKAGSREMLPFDDQEARNQVDIIDAKVLSNRKPPYPPFGGLYDALSDAGGEIYGITNEEAREANRIFGETEGIDLHPAAAVAAASLIKSARQGDIDLGSTVMLNITGGGEERFKKEHTLYYLKPSLVFDINPNEEEVMERVSRLVF